MPFVTKIDHNLPGVCHKVFNTYIRKMELHNRNDMDDREHDQVVKRNPELDDTSGCRLMTQALSGGALRIKQGKRPISTTAYVTHRGQECRRRHRAL